MILGIGHIGISTADTQRLVRFYVDLLGGEVVGEIDWNPGTKVDKVIGIPNSAAHGTLVRLPGNAFIEIFEYRAPLGKPKPQDYPVSDLGIPYFSLLVDDIAGEYARLKAAGVPFTTEPQDFVSAKCTYCRDPDGNIIELIEQAKGAATMMDGVVIS